MALIVMRKAKIIFLLIFIVLSACKKVSLNCGEPCNEFQGLVFQTEFENTLLAEGKYHQATFSETDFTLPALNSWNEFVAHDNIGMVHISYEDGDSTDRKASIVGDPECDGNSVLKFEIIRPHINEGFHKKGRVQLNVNENNCIREIYQKVRLRLHPDLEWLKSQNDRVSWFSLFEFWNNADWTNEKYPFRVTVNLFKDEKQPVDKMYFHVKGDMKDNCKICEWKVQWEELGGNFSVPFGEWIEVELYIKEGDNDHGQFYFAVTTQSGEKIVVFDLIRSTQHPEETCPDGFSHMQPLKLYTSGELIDRMHQAGKELSICWDDWSFYINRGQLY